MDASNADIAKRADVSEPTVTRFCRAIGCEGVRDFKLKLAQSVVVGRLYLPPVRQASPARMVRRSGTPSSPRPGTRSRLSSAASILPPSSAPRNCWQGRIRSWCFGLGGSSTALAQETQNRLFRYGVVVSAHSDPYIMKMMASALKPNDVVIAISGTGRTREVIEAVATARHYRAKAIAVTVPDSPLAREADLSLAVDVPEYPDALKPTASRYAFLAIIDLVSTAVGYRLDPAARETLRRIKYTVVTHRKGKESEPLGD